MVITYASIPKLYFILNPIFSICQDRIPIWSRAFAILYELLLRELAINN